LEDKLLGKDDGNATEEDSMSWEEKLVKYKATKPSEESTAV